MKRFLVLITIAATAFGAELGGLQFGGLLENSTGVVISENESFTDAANLRLEGTWDFGDYGGIETHVILSAALAPLDPLVNIREGSRMASILTDLEVSAAMNAQIMLGQLMYDPTDTSTMDTTGYGTLQHYQDSVIGALSSDLEPLLMRYLPYSSLARNDKILLDRALLKLYFKWVDLYIGRQMIAWGTGYGFNPTDVWNQKNPLDPNAPKAGVTAFRVEIPFGSLSGLSLVVRPGPDLEHTSGGLRVKGNLFGYDLSLCAMEIRSVESELYDVLSDYVGLDLRIPKKVMVGVDMAGQIGEVGVWLEGAVNNPVYDGMEYTDFDSVYAQVDIGLDYTFENGLYAMAEYYYNGLGKKDSDDYSPKDLMNLFSGEMAGFGQHYIMAGVRGSVLDRFSLNGFALFNATDLSAMLLPSVGVDVHDNLGVELIGQIGVGNQEESEYGGMFPGVVLKVTGYF